MNERLYVPREERFLASLFILAAIIAVLFALMMTQRSYAGCEYVITRIDDGKTTTDQPPVDRWGDATSPRDSLSPNTGGQIVTGEGYIDTETGQGCTP